MSLRGRLWLMLPRQLRELPPDLAAVLVLVGLTNVFVFVPYLDETPVRFVVGACFLLFAPGYAFVAALFPEASESDLDDSIEPPGSDGEPGVAPSVALSTSGRGIHLAERLGYAIGLSIAIVPLLGLGLNFTPFGIRLVPVMACASFFTVVMLIVAVIRRRSLSVEERFQVPYREWVGATPLERLRPDSRGDVALLLAVLLATTSIAYAVAVPPPGEEFTEFYLLAEGDNGELAADDYPETFTVGEPESLYVTIGNNEQETVEYTVVVQLQRVEHADNGTQTQPDGATAGEPRVVERAIVDRWSVIVEHDETWQQQRDIVIEGGPTGEDLRLAFLLFEGSPPADPTAEDADLDTYLEIAVEEG